MKKDKHLFLGVGAAFLMAAGCGTIAGAQQVFVAPCIPQTYPYVVVQPAVAPLQIPANSGGIASPIDSTKNFGEVTKWKKTVDRIAVLSDPYVPVAWKGDKPKVVYVWLGKAWYELPANVEMVKVKGKKRRVPMVTDTAPQTLRRHLPSIVAKRTPDAWFSDWTPQLEQKAMEWKFQWMGVVAPINVW